MITIFLSTAAILNDESLKSNYCFNILIGRGEGINQLESYDYYYNYLNTTGRIDAKRNFFDYHEVARLVIWDEIYTTGNYR